MKRTHQCPSCAGREIYTTEISAGGGYAPDLLPGPIHGGEAAGWKSTCAEPVATSSITSQSTISPKYGNRRSFGGINAAQLPNYGSAPGNCHAALAGAQPSFLGAVPESARAEPSRALSWSAPEVR
jgi:hypothetical protein